MSRIALIKQLARPSGVVLLSALGPGVGSVVVLTLAIANTDALRGGGLGIAALLLIGGALGCGLALLPTHVLSLLCGWSFGLPVGLLIVLSAATLGSPVGYALGHALAGPGLMRVIANNRKGAAICDAIARTSKPRAFFLVALLRLSPVVPYGSTNVLAALFNVSVLPFILGTFVGLAPRAAAVVLLGTGLERLDSDAPVSPWLWGLGIAATLLAMIVMSWAAKRALNQLAGESEAAPTQ
ncbi:MAG: TVP38/TMEM64 family protein [Phycisphaeraceae bacterium]